MIKIDLEFKGLIPPLEQNELSSLEANILKDGCRDPLVVWGGVLVDGHNRHEICSKHGLQYKTINMEFASREDAMDWIDRNQIGRRNLKPDVFKLVLGRIYNREKKAVGFQDAGPGRGKTLDQNEPVLSTADRIAAQHGVSPATVKRAGKLAEKEEEVRKEIFKPAPPPPITHAKPESNQESQKPIEQPAPKTKPPIYPIKTQEEIIEEAKRRIRIEEDAKKQQKKAVHVSHNSGENEWYTPAKYIDAARLAMGGIDTDPASCEQANKTVKAAVFFDSESNGLKQKWSGNTWMNPPYAQPLIKQFATAVSLKYESGEIKQAVILVNNATETEWFRIMAAKASMICFTSGRVKFIDKNGKPSGAPLQGQALIYMGENKQSFIDAFAEFGMIVEVKNV